MAAGSCVIPRAIVCPTVFGIGNSVPSPNRRPRFRNTGRLKGTDQKSTSDSAVREQRVSEFRFTVLDALAIPGLKIETGGTRHYISSKSATPAMAAW